MSPINFRCDSEYADLEIYEGNGCDAAADFAPKNIKPPSSADGLILPDAYPILVFVRRYVANISKLKNRRIGYSGRI